jgi:hypothetical protein
MKTFRSRSLALQLAVVLASAPLSTVGFGQRVAHAETTPPALADSLTGPAKEAYEAGKRIYALDDFAGAAVKFKVAYDLSKDYRLLKNVAACERALLHYARAYNLLDQYLREGGDKLLPDQISAARESMEALREFYSLVRATIEPAGALVRLDGVELGKAPLAPFAVDLGAHVLRVEAPGYKAADTKLDVPGKTDLSISITLQREVVVAPKLSVVAGASDAITIDGVAAGVGSFTGALKPGSHLVRVTAAGKKPYEAHMELAPGAVRTLQVTLVDDEAVGGGGVPTWLWIAGGAAVASGLAVGGYYLFKPSDQAGSRPSGGLDTISLKLWQGGR